MACHPILNRNPITLPCVCQECVCYDAASFVLAPYPPVLPPLPLPPPLQVSSLRLQSPRLARLALCGTRALQDLELRCARLAEVDIRPLNPGLAASHALR